ncbi:hypothetical protein C1646_690410 [Rhizophagus diaphanus]|nr:hypothetical protein C1646_690410 [Rhizophagus diaphanus] [Rhizophagus sp. MUCL 43196]
MRVKKQEKRKEKVAYIPYKKSTNNSDQMKNLKEKLSELDEIFKETENEMDWEKMKADVAWDIKDSYDLSSDKEFKEWSMKKNNFMLLGQKIISEAEKSEILKEYTMLNEDFTSRLKEENFATDTKGTGDKRPVPNSPGVEISRKKEEKKKDKKKKKTEEEF